jgi:phosphate acetyltransferase
MNSAIKHIRNRSAGLKKHVVFPEGDDPRVQKAAHYLVDKQICSVTLLHSGVLSSSETFPTLNYLDDPPNIRPFTQALWEKQQHKLNHPDQARKLLQNPLYYAASMVNAGLADACVAGAVYTTAEVIRCAIKVVGVKEDRNIISSTFLMSMPDYETFTYADCGVVPYPDERQLADIALESARTHERLTGNMAKVAMLSFSTKGSAPHERSQLVRDALQIAKQKDPDIVIDGELQFDAAFVPEVAARKAPDSVLSGRANVFIFPNLDAGNIAYKITERLAGAGATGPILQGLARPMMDLSRGCQPEDIINCACAAILMGED